MFTVQIVTSSPFGLLLKCQLPPLRKEAPVANVSSMNWRYVQRPLVTLAKIAKGEVTDFERTLVYK
jgi:hypothetical protein